MAYGLKVNFLLCKNGEKDCYLVNNLLLYKKLYIYILSYIVRVSLGTIAL